MALFLYSNPKDESMAVQNIQTSVIGVVLLVAFLIFDAITSNWQKRIFKSYKPTPYQAMAWSNFLSCIFLLTSLLQHPQSFVKTFHFITCHPDFLVNLMILSISSAFGQVCIFSVIDVFGK